MRLAYLLLLVLSCSLAITDVVMGESSGTDIVLTGSVQEGTGAGGVGTGSASTSPKSPELIKPLSETTTQKKTAYESSREQFVVVASRQAVGRASAADMQAKKSAMESAANEYREAAVAERDALQAIIKAQEGLSETERNVVALSEAQRQLESAQSEVGRASAALSIGVRIVASDAVLARELAVQARRSVAVYADKLKTLSKTRENLEDLDDKIARLERLEKRTPTQEADLIRLRGQRTAAEAEITAEGIDQLGDDTAELLALSAAMHERVAPSPESLEDEEEVFGMTEGGVELSQAVERAAQARIQQLEFQEMRAKDEERRLTRRFDRIESRLAAEEKSSKLEGGELEKHLNSIAKDEVVKLMSEERQRYVAERKLDGVAEGKALEEFNAALRAQEFPVIETEITSDDVDKVAAARFGLELGRMEEGRVKRGEERTRIAREQYRQQNMGTALVTLMARLLKSYGEFSGLARLGSLFIGDERLAEMREKVDQVFCSSIVGDPECYFKSKVCDGYIDAEPGGSALVARGPKGEAFGALHIEAEKSLPLVTFEGNVRVELFKYKVTYAISNALDKSLSYNVEFRAADKIVRAFAEQQVVDPGAVDGKLGADALLPLPSRTNYTQVCLVWSPSITTFDGSRASEFCVPVSQYDGAATKPFGQEELPGGVASAQNEIVIQENRFSPNRMTVGLGETLTWVSASDTSHSVVSTSGPDEFNNVTMDRDERFSFTFAVAGKYTYQSGTTTGMTGEIVVAETAPPTAPAAPSKDFEDF